MFAEFDVEDGYYLDEEATTTTRQLRRDKRRWKAKKQKEHQSPEKLAERSRKAKIRALVRKEQRKLAKRLRATQSVEKLTVLGQATRRDASEITNYVATQDNSEIYGESLDELYARLANHVLSDWTETGAQRAKIAVAYACSSLWLTRAEAQQNDMKWHYAIPIVQPDAVEPVRLAA